MQKRYITKRSIKRKSLGKDLLKGLLIELKRLAIAGATAGYILAGWWLVWLIVTR